MCAVPSPVPHFRQFFIFWPCSTLIKCFSKHCFQVFWCHTEQQSQCCTLRSALISQHCGQVLFSLSLQQFTHRRYHSLPNALHRHLFFFYVLHVNISDLKSPTQGIAPNQHFTEGFCLSQSLWLS